MEFPDSLDFSALIDDLNVGIILHNINTEILYINQYALKLLRLTENQAVGKDAFDEEWKFIDENGEVMPLKAYPVNRVIANKRPILSQVIGIADGTTSEVTWAVVNSKPQFDENHQIKEVLVVFTEITEIRRMQKQIESQKERFELAVAGTNDGLWDWDLITNQAYHSERFETMLGYSGSELPDTVEAWSDLIHPDDKALTFQTVDEYLKSGGVVDYESTFRMRTKKGKWRWISGRGKATFNKDGKPLRFLGFNTDVTDEVERNSQLEFASKHDPLTLLANRFLLNELMQTELERAKRQQGTIAVLYIDLDGFKPINDRFGHGVGDDVLKTVSQRMVHICRNNDIVSRLGGDEFVVVLTEIQNQLDVLPFTSRLLEEIRKPMNLSTDPSVRVVISTSIGIAIYDNNLDLGSETLIRQADLAMYEAKKLGKNQYALHDNKSDQVLKKYQLTVQEIFDGLESQEFELHFQPKINMKTSAVLGFEALIRWNKGNDTLLLPDSFLPIVSSSREVMVAITSWVFEQACKTLSGWRKKGHTWTISINISSYDLQKNNFAEDLFNIIENYPEVTSSMIQLEVLESSELGNLEQVKKSLIQLKEKGFTIALDDFGTGFSTLEYLKVLPVDTLKVDKSFVMDMTSNPASLAIVEASISMAEAFDCEVIAEGVEDIEHGELLLRLGCTNAQGYSISKPLREEDVEPWISEWNKPSEAKMYWQTILPIQLPYQKTLLKNLLEHRALYSDVCKFLHNKPLSRIFTIDVLDAKFGEWLNSPSAKKNLPLEVRENLSKYYLEFHQVFKKLSKLPSSDSNYLEELNILNLQIEKTLKQLVE